MMLMAMRYLYTKTVAAKDTSGQQLMETLLGANGEAGFSAGEPV